VVVSENGVYPQCESKQKKLFEREILIDQFFEGSPIFRQTHIIPYPSTFFGYGIFHGLVILWDIMEYYGIFLELDISGYSYLNHPDIVRVG
jgi:hypothetical protein